MNAKKWLKIVFVIPIVLTGLSLLLIQTFNLPLRFSNSISYDVKLNFIKNNQLMRDSNTIVVGSSMALNNVNGVKLEDSSKKIEKVANLSSWGLQVSEVLQLIKLIKLDNINFIIYSTQYGDFSRDVLKNIDENEVKKYLNSQFTIYPYKVTIRGLMVNLLNNIRYKENYLNPNKYSYLNYDRTGGVNFLFGSKYIDKIRWQGDYQKKYNLSKKSFEDLIELSRMSEAHNIKLIVITTPMRESILYGNTDLLDIFNEYTNELKSLSMKHNFMYLNTHKTLKLSDEYFVDKTHLNKSGATLVSKEIIKLIK